MYCCISRLESYPERRIIFALSREEIDLILEGYALAAPASVTKLFRDEERLRILFAGDQLQKPFLEHDCCRHFPAAFFLSAESLEELKEGKLLSRRFPLRPKHVEFYIACADSQGETEDVIRRHGILKHPTVFRCSSMKPGDIRPSLN